MKFKGEKGTMINGTRAFKNLTKSLFLSSTPDIFSSVGALVFSVKKGAAAMDNTGTYEVIGPISGVQRSVLSLAENKGRRTSGLGTQAGILFFG